MTGQVPGLVLPAYYSYYDSPVKIVASADGRVRVWRISAEGGWRDESGLFKEIVFAVGGEVFKRPAAEFVQDVERYRAENLSGQGPIFALYETVNTIVDSARRERRPLTIEERALVAGIRRRTFVMFEEQLLAAGDEAADPGLGS
ncbi:hypothetical protein KBX37_05650 [Micromonospora sp. U56]|uniref:hypothetical protein n=1 Tax=Micromonospora sp. U56 TaxID=2824900 RepID=UPI001B399F4E|nr:hypothetical protein [Micromonospora sp. U56]MBQ0892592.1 hypothetical protein [Micromonospora sp. U56]